MNRRYASFLSLSLSLSLMAGGVFAQTIPSATAPRYTTPYVNKHSQLEAMNPHPASAPMTLYNADTALGSQTGGRRVQSPLNTGTQSRAKRARVPQTAGAASSAAAGGVYSNDLWNAGQTYASPETSDPYSARVKPR